MRIRDRSARHVARSAGLALLAGLVVGDGGSIAAQEREAVPAFPAQGEAITVDVVVLDKAGRPVLDLARDEFRITENGKPRDPGETRGLLPPGQYTLRATARQGARLAEERSELELQAPSRASPTLPVSRAASASQAADDPSEPLDSDVARFLERAGSYVLAYEETFRLVVTEEAYTQWVDPPFDSRGERITNRRTRADLVFVRTPLVGACPWTSLRDVFEVDGQKVRDREGRLETLFRDEAYASALAKASAILRESVRYNIGTAFRTVNVPTLPLMFLRPDNQNRFRFRRKGTRWFHGVEGVELEFEETRRPTLVTSIEVHDVPAKGRFWIDATRGTILRSDTTFLIPPDRASGRVAVDYMPQKDLAIWGPERMTELYRDLNDRFFNGRTECTARYSNYRFFMVSTSETARVPEPP